MGYPGIPASAFYNVRSDGDGSPASAKLWRDLNARALFLAYGRGRVSSCWATHEVPTGAVSGSVDDEWILGDFMLPPQGTADGLADVWVYVTSYSVGGDLNIRALGVTSPVVTSNRATAFPGDVIGTITIGATGWASVTGVQLPTTDNPIMLRVTAENGCSFTIGAICVIGAATSAIPDGGTAPTSFTKLSVAHHEEEDRPLDVSTLRRIAHTYDMVAAKYPRTLASRSFKTNTATRTAAGAPATDAVTQVTLRYKVRRGPQTSNCTLKVYASQTDNGGTGAAGQIEVFVDGTSRGTVAVAKGETGAFHSITISAGWTANTTHEVRIEAYAGYNAGSNDTITVNEIVLTENAYTESNFFVLSTARLDSVAPRRYAVPWGELAAGKPIYASYDETTVQDRHADRASLARNALFCAQHLRATLIADRLGQTASSTSAGKTSAATMARAQHTGNQGEGTARVWVLARRSGTADSTVRPVLYVKKDGTAQQSAFLRLGDDHETIDSTTIRKWRYLGEVEITPGTEHALTVHAGWASIATDASGAASTDTVVVEGVCIFGVPRGEDPLRQYFYQADAYTTSNAIPDNDIVTGLSKTIVVPSSRAFLIDRLRVYVGVSHGTPTQLIYSLGNGTRTVTFRAAGHAGDTGTWWSDSTGGFIGDATPDAVLSAFIGDSSAGTWTLKVYDNAAGTTGTLTDFRLELW